jgi:primosomal protein N' (replication factor Y)
MTTMYAQVQLLNGFERPLWYTVPDDLIPTIKRGSVVSVPLQRRNESALVTDLFTQLPTKVAFKIKPLTGLAPFPVDLNYAQFVTTISNYYFIPPLVLYQRVRHFLQAKENPDVDLHHLEPTGQPLPVRLTDEQAAVVDYVTPFIITPAYTPTLVHGVTGSGKTEVYKKLITTALQNNKTIILLLPEVTLALQFEHLLRTQLPTAPIIGFHSATKISEKRQLWQTLINQQALLIIGVHLPILLPIPNLGLIIVDEEHETGFQEKKHPKLNSKEMAIWRAHQYKIPIVLGSATPALTSLYNVERHGWKLFSITKRFAGDFPAMHKVLLTDPSARRRPVFWISRELEQAVHACIAKKEQVIIFLNRRGFSFFVQCKSCGFVFNCNACSVSLTLHVDHTKRTIPAAPQNGQLRCHYCDYAIPLPSTCPGCKAPEKELIKKGIGTQQVVQLFEQRFPTAVIARADLDSTSKKRAWQETVDQFKAGTIDILIGTQTITKGYHFPNVTLVGVLWADLNLHFPTYNASETTLQQLIQVAGRAGRQRPGGKVIVQVMRDHPIFDYLDEQKYLAFCKQELVDRQESFYPPFARIACIELKASDPVGIEADAQKLADMLQKVNAEQQLDVSILGPAMPLVYRIQNCEVRHILLKAATFKALQHLIESVQDCPLASNVFVVVNP